MIESIRVALEKRLNADALSPEIVRKYNEAMDAMWHRRKFLTAKGRSWADEVIEVTIAMVVNARIGRIRDRLGDRRTVSAEEAMVMLEHVAPSDRRTKQICRGLAASPDVTTIWFPDWAGNMHETQTWEFDRIPSLVFVPRNCEIPPAYEGGRTLVLRVTRELQRP